MVVSSASWRSAGSPWSGLLADDAGGGETECGHDGCNDDERTVRGTCHASLLSSTMAVIAICWPWSIRMQQAFNKNTDEDVIYLMEPSTFNK
ncbi:hypothetical protein AB6813_03045 [bacterium RCC_150]